ncbi:uncharacterized protein LOC129748078 [Uranotaenia lowii]|uniref:uncharacterized protein LOC129747311 n=1 Tax=Uranotaenia lowii TaxID=190385 RepID=UPI00247B1939|nr:uncharacterized protein LOC129747311 [Uranotaenia lowii]XP_055598525.1 uncharacterized protein LOC129748078 [Uranotaenia lowii]
MENSYLNIAHVYGRKAENYAKHRRFDEAIESHRKAVVNLDEAIKLSPTSAIVVESLQLQRKYHLKQVEFLRHKKQQYERYMKALEYQRRRNPEYLAQRMENMEKYHVLQLSIYKNLDDTDALLESLSKTRPEAIAGEGRKNSSLEDLIKLNHSLHIMIHQMVQNFDECSTENEVLKEKLSMYEKEKENNPSGKGTGRLSSDQRKGNATLEADRSILEAIDFHSEELPALAPLELPTFDLPDFDKS